MDEKVGEEKFDRYISSFKIYIETFAVVCVFFLDT